MLLMADMMNSHFAYRPKWMEIEGRREQAQSVESIYLFVGFVGFGWGRIVIVSPLGRARAKSAASYISN